MLKGCDGTTVSAAGAAAFGELDAGTKAAAKSKDYSQAARAFRTLASELGGVEKVVAAFECIGVSPFYANHLAEWPLPPSASRPPPPPPPKPPPTKRPPPHERSVAWSGTASWRDVPAGVDRGGPMPRRIIQTWRDGALPEQLAGYAARVRALHPESAGYVHLFFTDDDIYAFLKEREPGWLPLYESLVHAPIQRVDLFRYVAVLHYGGCYLDLDLLLGNPLDSILDEPRGAAFPFERLVDADVHPTLARAGALSQVGQYAFCAAPRHPFLLAILRYVRRAAADPEWAAVPPPAEGDEDDDKTVHYTTGPALVTRAFYEGGFGAQVALMYASPLGPSDAAGWGGFGPFGVHMHAGTWKGNELDASRLLARADHHRGNGALRRAAGLYKRAAAHGGMSKADAHSALESYMACHADGGSEAAGLIDLALDYALQRGWENAERSLALADDAAARDGSKSSLAAVRYARWRVEARRAVEAGDVDAEEAAAEHLRAAAALAPRSSEYALALVGAQLRQPAIHAAGAVRMLEDALRIERAEREADGGGGGGVEAVAAPRTLAYILYVWHSSQLLQSAMLAVPSLAAAARAVFEPRDDNLAATPCDLRAGRAAPRRAAAPAAGRRERAVDRPAHLLRAWTPTRAAAAAAPSSSPSTTWACRCLCRKDAPSERRRG